MRSNIADYNAVVEAASKFTRSVAEGNSKYAKELFTEWEPGTLLEALQHPWLRSTLGWSLLALCL